jgi:nucleotide-binding universal stress UspA family protein
LVSQKRILVPLGPESKDLKGVYHAIALAERMEAKILILQIENQNDVKDIDGWKEEVLLDLVSTASREGLSVSHHIARGPWEQEILNVLREESIELVVLGEDRQMARFFLRIRPENPVQLIQVKEKNNVDYL